VDPATKPDGAKTGAEKDHGKEPRDSAKVKDSYTVTRTGIGIGIVGLRRSIRMAGRRMCGHDPRVIKTSSERLKKLVEVAAVLHDMVEFFKNALELFVECGQNAGLLVLILDDAPLISSDVSLHLSNL
jgi:hypothetical protein